MTAKNASEVCRCCVFWEAQAGYGFGHATKGQCRRFPPPSYDRDWPVTASDDWCGEQKMRTE